MKIKRLSCRVAVVSALTLSSVAFAPSVLANADNAGEFYIGAKTGWSQTEDNTYGDADQWANSVFGGYQLNNWLSIEGGYNYLGESKSRGYDVEIQNLELGLKADWNITKNFIFFTKIGGSYNFVDADSYRNNGSDDGDNGSFMVGGGLEYNLTHNLKLRGEYQYFKEVADYDDINLKETDVNYGSLGIVYSFGSPAPVVAPIVVEPIVEEPVVAPAPQAVTLSTESFGSSSAELTEGTKQALSPVVNSMTQSADVSAVVIGHTDATGSEEYNLTLSEKRAQFVTDYLTSQGVAADQITTIGKGESEPTADNSTKEGRAANRRVEVTYK